MVVRPHDCPRCGDAIEPGDVYSVLDLLDADGDVAVILCRDCGGDLRSFLAGEAVDPVDGATANGPSRTE